MSCSNPIKLKITDAMRASRCFYANQEWVELPCGKCDDCRVSHAKEWGFRCMCEYESKSDIVKSRSWFITLTYDDDHNPKCLVFDHVKQFINSLRHKYKNCDIKYFYCGEYGSKNYRPHYHMIIFDLPISDLVPININFQGDQYYTSDYLWELWGRGMICIGEVNFQSCNYTARYTLKKNETDCDLRVSHGFGKDYFLDHWKDIITNNYVVVASNGGVYRSHIPKYFLKLYKKFILNDDKKKYAKYLKWKRSQFDIYERNIYRCITDRDKVGRVRLSELAVVSAPVRISRETNTQLKQAIYDMYHERMDI